MNDERLMMKECGSQTIGSEAVNGTARLGFTKPIKSTGNEMLIVMETDGSIGAKGFAAEFETVFGFTSDHMKHFLSTYQK